MTTSTLVPEISEFIGMAQPIWSVTDYHDVISSQATSWTKLSIPFFCWTMRAHRYLSRRTILVAWVSTRIEALKPSRLCIRGLWRIEIPPEMPV